MPTMEEELRQCLTQRLIPFWKNLRDDRFGGYIGRVDFYLTAHPEADKGGILNSRILWFFSAAAAFLNDASLIPYAEHAYRFLTDAFFDREYGGVYWSVGRDGVPQDETKHTYNLAFAIYALSAYSSLMNDASAKAYAYSIYHTIEQHCRDEGGYLEAFTRNFQPVENEKLSENGVIAARTMNTLLHVFEGYSALYELTHDNEVGQRIREIVELFLNKVYNPQKRRQEVFFDHEYRSLIDLQSYGHDIESSWLLKWGCDLVGDDALSSRLNRALSDMALCVYENAFRDDSLLNESENGKADNTRVWWVQAEAMLGFMNAYQLNPERQEYAQAVKALWHYIQTYMEDHRSGGEWYWCLNEHHVPASRQDIVEPWKCPYHNGRMCIEMLKRLNVRPLN